MKLKSKVSILIIFITMAIYLSIDLFNNEENLQIKTLEGDSDELGYININFSYDLNGFVNSKYIINGENKIKEKELYKLPKDYNVVNELIDVSSGSDSIAHVGFERNTESKNNIEDISFVIDEKKEDSEKGVFISEGSDEKIDSEKLEMKNFIRTKHKLADKDLNEYSERVLSSKRYKNDLYVFVFYMSNDFTEENIANNKNTSTIDIIKINPKNKKIETVKSINLSEYFYKKYKNIKSIDVSYSSKSEEEVYILIETLNSDIGDNGLSRLHLLKYNVSENKEKIIELKTKENFRLQQAKLENENLYMLTLDDNNVKDTINLNLLTYDISNDAISEDSYKIDSKEERNVINTLIDKNKIIVCTSKTDPIVTWDNKTILYIINKNSKEVVYKGELQFNSSNSNLEFEIK